MWKYNILSTIALLLASSFGIATYTEQRDDTSDGYLNNSQIVADFFDSWFTEACVDKIRECIDEDCLGCSNTAETRGRELFMRGARKSSGSEDDWDWHGGGCSHCGWYHLNCTDIYDGAREFWNCTGSGGNETLFCETLNECWWGDV